MFKLRPEQIEALDAQALEGFVKRASEHIAAAFPRHSQQLDGTTRREVILFGLERARRHRIRFERNILRYIDLMFMLGSEFDEDPLLPHSTDVFVREGRFHESILMTRLEDWVSESLRATAGEGYELFHEALQRASRVPLMNISDRWMQASELMPRVMVRLHDVYPQKLAQLDPVEIARAFDGFVKTACHHSLGSERGVTLIGLLSLFLGGGFDRDPQFPWVKRVLAEKSPRDATTRLGRLHAEALAELRRWL